MNERGDLTRRGMLRAAACAGVAALGGRFASAALRPPPRSLTFRHTHTGESLTTVYCRDGCYLPEELAKIDSILRDFRTGEVAPIEPALLDALHDLTVALGSPAPYEVISAFRSPSTNERLRQESGGVARNSLHLVGRAIDVRLCGVPTRDLRDAAVAAAAGGVGFYERSDFVHLDTGRVRSW